MQKLEVRAGALVVPPITLREVLDVGGWSGLLRCPGCGRYIEPVAATGAYGLCPGCLREVPYEDD